MASAAGVARVITARSSASLREDAVFDAEASVVRHEG